MIEPVQGVQNGEAHTKNSLESIIPERIEDDDADGNARRHQGDQR
jgi:hypothetical protein